MKLFIKKRIIATNRIKTRRSTFLFQDGKTVVFQDNKIFLIT